MSLRALIAALVVLGAVAALLFGTTRGASRAAPVQDGVRPATLRVAPQGPAGTVVYGRAARSGPFGDDTRGLAAVSLQGPDRVTMLRGVTTCCMAWSSARSLLAIATEGSPGPGLGVVAVGSDTYRRLAFGGQSRGLVPGGWSANGRRLAVSRLSRDSGRPAGVYVAQWGNDTFRLVLRTPPREIDRVLSMSSDGSHVLLFRAPAKGAPGLAGVLYALELRPGRPRLARLTPAHFSSLCCHFGVPATWSPDGRHVALAAYRRGVEGVESRSAVYVVNADGSRLHRISPWGSEIRTAAWSPTGRWIAFDRMQVPPQHALYIEHPDGSKLHAVDLPATIGGSCCAQWTADGRYLVYERGRINRDQSLFVVNVAGRPAERRLTGPNGSYFSFVVTGSTGG